LDLKLTCKINLFFYLGMPTMNRIYLKICLKEK
jgi:hypothetical protein